MAKTLIWSVALIVSALILASDGINAQRVMLPPEDPAPAPAPAPEESSATPVMVENFPAAQVVDVRGFPLSVTVEGTVDVGNLPAVQNVAGTVDVGNLPLDAGGSLRVAVSETSRLHFVDFSQSEFAEGTGMLTLSRACNAEVPGTRLCSGPELLNSIPPAPDPPAGGILIMLGMSRDASLGPIESVISSCISSSGIVFDCPARPYPAACCGF